MMLGWAHLPAFSYLKSDPKQTERSSFSGRANYIEIINPDTKACYITDSAGRYGNIKLVESGGKFCLENW